MISLVRLAGTHIFRPDHRSGPTVPGSPGAGGGGKDPLGASRGAADVLGVGADAKEDARGRVDVSGVTADAVGGAGVMAGGEGLFTRNRMPTVAAATSPLITSAVRRVSPEAWAPTLANSAGLKDAGSSSPASWIGRRL